MNTTLTQDLKIQMIQATGGIITWLSPDFELRSGLAFVRAFDTDNNLYLFVQIENTEYVDEISKRRLVLTIQNTNDRFFLGASGKGDLINDAELESDLWNEIVENWFSDFNQQQKPMLIKLPIDNVHNLRPGVE